ncbi:hypothetical protein HYH03_009896 [Edaphochlamys debaryana]|uniref:Uncharacterized protein n=1 Tax=Edaphochlamys debaryana TaxID=47281 RepID=A0A835XWY2_9CHLO|nr:hypothetical protein HYH03_009896 [Edaphochlamys debaryana]|eukprot:KAG2491733.1 hypothetical protein HYH03_009896 [Edaphochlamys debaryana]
MQLQSRAQASISATHGSARRPAVALPAAVLPQAAWRQRCASLVCSSSSASAASPEPARDPASSSTPPASSSAASPAPSGGGGPLGAIKRFFLGDKLDKEKLAQLGMGAFASYGFISNVTYGVCLAIAWLSFVKATGQSPLWPGQWAPFLGFYAGLWTMQNFVRPLRFSLAIALAPVFERMILWIAAKTGLAKQWAFGVWLTGFALVTCASLFGSLYALGGFPPGPPPAA